MKFDFKNSLFQLVIFFTLLNPNIALSNKPFDSCHAILNQSTSNNSFLSSALEACALVVSISKCITSRISNLEFYQIQKITLQITNQFPSEEYVYVGLGQSPTPILAYLKASGIEDAVNLPLSDFRSYPGSANMPFPYLTLFHSWEDKLFNHFNRFLPSKTELRGKKVLIIDYAQTGESLGAAKSYLSNYYESLGLNDLVTAVAITGHSNKLVPDLADEFIITLNLLSAVKLSMRFESYERFSEFGEFNLVEHSSLSLKQNPLYLELIDSFRSRINTNFNN